MMHSFINESNPEPDAPLTRAALIDIGSNSIRTMTAELEAGRLVCSEKTVYTTRLAEGLLQTGLLSDARMEQSLAVIRAFAKEPLARKIPVFAYATSAVRDAGNREAFCAAVRACIGDRLAVLSGEQEARYAFLAATGGRGGMLDIGGGSTQAVTPLIARSFPLGCVRARDLCPQNVLADIRPAVNARLDAIADLRGIHAAHWTGVGGSITTLAALAAECTTYDRNRVNGFMLLPDALAKLLARLEQLGEARAKLPLLAKRHDVILQGGAILLYFMERLDIAALRVSDADGLEGYAMHLFKLEGAPLR